MKLLTARAALLLAAFATLAAPSGAATCKFHELSARKFTREIRVDSRGIACEFTTFASAFTYVTAQTRSITAPWTVEVRPGSGYTATSITVPTYTHVRGLPGIASPSTAHLGQPKFTGTATTGALVTMGDFSSWDGVAVVAGATSMTGAVKIFDTTGVTASISNTLISVPTTLADTQNVYGIYNGAAGVLTVTGVNFLSVGTRTKAWGLLNLGESADVWGGHWAGSASQLMMFQNNISAKTLRLNFVQIDTLAGGVDLTNTAGNLQTFGTAYGTSSGTITNSTLCAGTLYVAACTPASATAACVANQVCLDSGFLYFCPTTNTWVRSPLATWP